MDSRSPISGSEIGFKCFCKPVAFSNLYYLLLKDASHRKVIKALKNLLQFLQVAGGGKELIELALNSQFTDFEDVIQNSPALKQGEIALIHARKKKVPHLEGPFLF